VNVLEFVVADDFENSVAVLGGKIAVRLQFPLTRECIVDDDSWQPVRHLISATIPTILVCGGQIIGIEVVPAEFVGKIVVGGNLGNISGQRRGVEDNFSQSRLAAARYAADKI